MLLGKDTLKGQDVKYNTDQTNPFRHFNQATRLLRDHLGWHISQQEWLSNALAWSGTGQGVKTNLFLNHLMPEGFFRKTKDAQALMFSSVLEENVQISLSHTGRISESTLEGWVATSDLRIWGQASNHLKLFPTMNGREMTLNEKLGPYWSPEVVEKWTAW